MTLHTPPVATAAMTMRCSAEHVFQAIVDPEVTTKFWFSSSTGPLEAGARVTWTWDVVGASAIVEVDEIVPNERVAMTWGDGNVGSPVVWTLTKLGDERTFLKVENSGFVGTADEQVAAALDSTGGFTWVLAGMKAWLEHGIELNLVPDAYPDELH